MVDEHLMRTLISTQRGGIAHLLEWVAHKIGGCWLRSEVVGVTFLNEDRSSRQEAIRKLVKHQELVLRPSSSEMHPGAIGVFVPGGRQLGLLECELGRETDRAMRAGVKFLCFVSTLIGKKQYRRRLEIIILRWQP